MNNEKQLLLQNPLVKEISLDFARQVVTTNGVWDDFVKSNEPVREWEITAFKENRGVVWGKRENGSYSSSEKQTGIYSEQSFLNDPKCSIFSVRRLSDSEIFVVGDEVETPAMKMKIVDLFLSENGQIYFNGSYLLHGFQKARTPLFVTKDNKEIFNVDECFWVNPFWGIEKGVGGEKHMSQVNSFSTEQAATEYITLNKPCLSVQDVNELLIKKHFMDEKAILQKVIELAKSKQNNS